MGGGLGATSLGFYHMKKYVIIISSLIFALVMGVLGGFLPSLRAARLNIVTALRAG